MENISPGKYSLPGRIKLLKTEKNQIAIVRNRSSRIIMKDGEAILGIAEKIRSVEGKTVQISLMTDAPVCSKTVDFLKKNQISIIPLI